MLSVRSEQLRRRKLEPRIDAALLDALRGRLDQLLRAWVQLATALMDEERDRHAPGALARDTPVGPALDHAGDPLLTPAGRPLHSADIAQRMLAQRRLLHADEPLRRGPENHWGLMPPTMRVAVHERLLVQQPPAAEQRLDDDRVGLIYPQSGHQRCAFEKAAVVTDGIGDR